jgi:hypothetical protein
MFAAKCLVNMARGRYNYRQPSYTVKIFEGIECRVVPEEGIIVIFICAFPLLRGNCSSQIWLIYVEMFTNFYFIFIIKAGHSKQLYII